MRRGPDESEAKRTPVETIIWKKKTRKSGAKRTMIESEKIIRKKKLAWANISHIIRWLMKEVMDGKMKVKMGPGRMRIVMINDLLETERDNDFKGRAGDKQVC